MNHIPFKGAADVRTAIAGKQITVAAINVGRGDAGAERRDADPQSGFDELGADFACAGSAHLQGTGIQYRARVAARYGRSERAPRRCSRGFVKAVGQAANDPEFKAKAAQIYAPLRYLPPDKYAEALKDAEAQFRLLWKEVPWTDK